MAPQNALYDRTEKAYLASDSFSPVITANDASPYLNQLLAVQLGILQTDSTYMGWVPSVAAVKAPSRILNASDLRLVLKAIRSRRILHMTYQSMNQLTPTTRTVSPHAIAFDGSRWHIRAYCHERQDYRDFVFGRILGITVGDGSPIDPAADSVWQREIDAIIEPHPALSPAQKHAVELDYGMTNGQLVMKTREALLFYLLRHLALLRESHDPAWSNYLALVNRDVLKPFFESHGFSTVETPKD
jgi:predicted DNA-binding transcriptional regulator YafY